jgi:hypothetical protein
VKKARSKPGVKTPVKRSPVAIDKLVVNADDVGSLYSGNHNAEESKHNKETMKLVESG